VLLDGAILWWIVSLEPEASPEELKWPDFISKLLLIISPIYILPIKRNNQEITSTNTKRTKIEKIVIEFQDPIITTPYLET